MLREINTPSSSVRTRRACMTSCFGGGAESTSNSLICIPGNEATNETAGLAAALPQNRVPTNYNAARARFKQHLSREWAASNRHSKPYRIVGPARVKPETRWASTGRRAWSWPAWGLATPLCWWRTVTGSGWTTTRTATTAITGFRRMRPIYWRMSGGGLWPDTESSVGVTQHYRRSSPMLTDGALVPEVPGASMTPSTWTMSPRTETEEESVPAVEHLRRLGWLWRAPPMPERQHKGSF